MAKLAQRMSIESPAMEPLTLFGLFAVSSMLVCYALEERHAHYTLAFAAACLLGSAYGFLQGAWPFGVLEAVWSLIALRKWRARKNIQMKVSR